MFDSVEQQIEQRNIKMKKLAIQLEQLDDQVDGFLKQIKVTPEQLTTFLSDQTNFSKENWEELEQQRKKLDDKLRLELDQIRNPKKIKKNYASLQVQKHWLHVK